MMEKFRNKYRTSSHRKPNWDYSSNAFYFLTIVTQNRECNLGNIGYSNHNATIELSDFGKIVENEWYKSFEIRNELILHQWILMPNHLHAIIEIHNETIENKNNISSEIVTIKRNMPIRLPKSISSFIAGFKSSVNTKIDDYIDANKLQIPKYNRNNHFFQPNYYDHIIRNQSEYDRISNYIINNPSKWNNDKLNESSI